MSGTWNVNEIRKQFPLLKNQNIAYLDNAATSQKPTVVLDAAREFYDNYNANPFRGLYELSEEATDRYEHARKAVQKFINARHPEEIIFTRNATEGLNLAAFSLGELVLKPGDEILVSISEHHSNLLPWQQAAKRTGASVRYLECEKDGTYTADALKKMLTPRTKILAMAQVSNVFGRVNDLKKFAEICHSQGVILVADGAQSVPHMPVDVQELGVDFLAFSGHKMLAPEGIGVLYGKLEWLEKMPPFLTGGEMIESVSREGAVYAEVPHKFEAGTVNAGGAVALEAAINFINETGFDNIQRWEDYLTELAFEKLRKIPYVHVIGSEKASDHHGILTFAVEGVHPHDVAAILSADGIAVRAGHHCAQPLHQYLGVMSTSRASLAFYNTEDEVLRFVESVKQLRRKMGYAE